MIPRLRHELGPEDQPPQRKLKKGDEVEAIVLEVSPENQRISLGLKQAQEDPWAGISGRYRIGQLIKGKVSKLASFGAFVELEEGVDGPRAHSARSATTTSPRSATCSSPPGSRGARHQDRPDRPPHRPEHQGRQDGRKRSSRSDDSMLEGLRPGEDLVDLAGAFRRRARFRRQARRVVARRPARRNKAVTGEQAGIVRENFIPDISARVFCSAFRI
jgi:hypothetical protein